MIVLDDMLPRIGVEAGRATATSRGLTVPGPETSTRSSTALRSGCARTWSCLEVDTQPTGTAIVFLPDSSSTALTAAYDDLAEAYAVPDPQEVPDAVLRRTRAVDPERLLRAPIWDELRRLRELPDGEARPLVAELLAGAGLATPR